MVVSAMAMLLMASLIVMLHFSRIMVKREAIEKATQALEGTVQCVDNILLSIEQATGNVYFTMLPHLNNPDKIREYSRRIVETNPYVAGCGIAMKPYFFKGRELFMAYAQREERGLRSQNSPIVMLDTIGNTPYTQQRWYTLAMELCKPVWTRLQRGEDGIEEPLATFCLPIMGIDGKSLGVIGVDISLNYLSHIVLSTKPSANSYCTLVDGDGSFLMHPDSRKLLEQTDYSQMDQAAAAAIREASQAMRSGESGYRPFTMDNTDYYIFFKPFVREAVPGRSMEDLSWSAGIIYPEDDIFGDYNRLLYYVFAIAGGGLLLLFVLIRAFIHHQLLPLRLLTASAQRIARGNYKEIIPYNPQNDEIGRLQNHFQQMQDSLALNVGELEQLTDMLHKRGEELKAAYDRVRQADRMKTAFLHNMTNQMVGPARVIDTDVQSLCDVSRHVEAAETGRLVGDIQQNGKTIAELLNNMLRVAEQETAEEERL